MKLLQWRQAVLTQTGMCEGTTGASGFFSNTTGQPPKPPALPLDSVFSDFCVAKPDLTEFGCHFIEWTNNTNLCPNGEEPSPWPGITCADYNLNGNVVTGYKYNEEFKCLLLGKLPNALGNLTAITH
eukprot:scaffold547301_cov39-Prasinocladus_malaysianus.AAC.1